MRSLDDIWQKYINKDRLRVQTLNDLIWHLEYDADPIEAIIMATDIAVEVELKELYPHIAKHLDDEDDAIREVTVGYILGRLQLTEYAKKGFKMAQEDPEENVRDLAIFNIGAVLNKINDQKFQHEIADYLYQRLIDKDDSFKGAAYRSILTAMQVPELEQPGVKDLEESVDFDLVERFKKKYGIDA